MKLHTLAVHAGDRRKLGDYVPVTTPIYGATSYFYDSLEELDRVFGNEVEGQSYARYSNPTTDALERQIAALEGADAVFATSSGMAALHLALVVALTDRRKSIVAADVLYGQTLILLMNVLEPSGVKIRFADPCDPAAFEKTVAEAKPACVLFETISNPLMRVPDVERLARIAREHQALSVVDATFTTPVLMRPLELGVDMVVHSATKYLAGHGDVLGGAVATHAEHQLVLQATSRTLGPNLGPFEAYLTMRGIKTLPLRIEKQCRNAVLAAEWLNDHPKIERVHFPGDPAHADAETIGRQFPSGMFGGMLSFEIRDAGREEVFRFIDALEMIVRATSLGDVHSMILYPAMSSHRDLAPKHRQRLGIADNLLRFSAGIEADEDIIADLDRALAAV